MKYLLRLTAFTFFILGLAADASGQQAKLQGIVSYGDGGPAARVTVNVLDGPTTKTDSKGHFRVDFPSSVAPGRATRILVPGWRVFDPIFGECWAQHKEISQEDLKVTIVALNSEAAHLNRKRLGAIVAEFRSRLTSQQKQLTSQQKTIAALRNESDRREFENQKFDFLRKYEKEYGVPAEMLKEAIDRWARTRDTADKAESARKAFWAGDWDAAIAIAEEALPPAIEVLKQGNRQRRKEKAEESSKIIDLSMSAGGSAFMKYDFDRAIRSYQSLKELFEADEISKEDFPNAWNDLNGLIANAKSELGERAAGPRSRQLLQESLAEFRQIEARYSREQAPEEWAGVQMVLGNTLIRLGERASPEESVRYLNEGVEAQRASLQVFTRESSPSDWARVQSNLGFVLTALGMRAEGEEARKILGEAVAAGRAALEVVNRETYPRGWVITQINLASALTFLGQEVGEGEGFNYLNEAVERSREAIKVCHAAKGELVDLGALSQVSLGTGLTLIGAWTKGEAGVKRLDEAIAACNAAAQVYGGERSPQDWAKSRVCVGIAQSLAGERVGAEEGRRRLNDALTALRDALGVLTREHFPQPWVGTSLKLSETLEKLAVRAGGDEGVKRLGEAVAIYRELLQVATRESSPRRWGQVQFSLGVALSAAAGQAEREQSIEKLREAVAAYRAALEVRTREASPEEWAQTQYKLGSALATLAERVDGRESIQLRLDAMKAFLNASEVFTPDKFPQRSALVQNDLGVVAGSLGERLGGEEGNKWLRNGARTLRLALEVRTREASPEGWVETQRNLARVYLALRDWPASAEAYAAILQFRPDEESFLRASTLYHEKLFNFEKAFALTQQWLAQDPENVVAQVVFTEQHFTSARFAECARRSSKLLADPKLPPGLSVPLRVVEIANLLATSQDNQVPAKLDALIAEVSRQPAEFRISWRFSGMRYFISQNEKLSRSRAWLEKLFDALSSEGHDDMMKALRGAQAAFVERRRF